MTRTLLTMLALAGLAACGGGGDREDLATADSLSRDLQLAPVDTSAELNDQPAPDTAAAPAPAPAPATPKPAPPKRNPQPAAPAPAPAASPAPAPAPAPAAPPTLAAGTSITAATDAEITSKTNKPGDEITATIGADIKDASGRVVIPKGSKVVLKVTAIKPSDSKSDTTGTLTLDAVGVQVNGSDRPIVATISGVKTHLQGRGTDATDVAKVAGGTAAGAIVGKVLGGGSKGAIIGGIIGGAVGTQRAVETKDRDVVLPAGTAITIKLDQTLAMASTGT
jgi:hypothetical protein